MASEPLHVRVALALGWTKPYDRGDGLWLAQKPETTIYEEVPRFDVSWCASGKYIQIYEILLHPEYFLTTNPMLGGWLAESRKETGTKKNEKLRGFGKTPLEAVCNAILSMSKEGKLNV